MGVYLVSLPNQFDLETFVVDRVGEVSADKFVGSQFGSVDCDGTLIARGGATLSSDILSNLPTSNPNNVGGLWNNAGAINVSTQDVIHNEGVMSLDIIDGAPFINGMSDGYIEFTAMNTTATTNGSYLFFSNPDCGLQISPMANDYIVIDGERFDTFATTFRAVFPVDLQSENTIRINLGNPHSVEVNGVTQELEYIVGNENSPLELMSDIDLAAFNSNMIGYYDNLKFHNSVDILSYTWNSSIDTFEESVEGVDATTVEREWLSSVVPVEKYGYNSIPYETKNHYIPEVTIPFAPLPINLSNTPSNIDRAYLRDRATKEPYIPTWPTGSQYPTFTEKAVADLERNPDCWMYQKSMTCFSIMSEFHSFAGHATLLSPRHAMIAEHIWDDFGSPLTQSFTFEDMNGNQQTVTSLDSEFIFPLTELRSDMVIVLLSEEITLDVDFATFFTDADFATYDYRDVTGCGPSKEGYMSIDKISQVHAAGLQNPLADQPEYEWSRWDNIMGDVGRVGDSSSPYFVYHGATLFFVAIATSSGGYPYVGGECIFNNINQRSLKS
jgi:hypothetical protein